VLTPLQDLTFATAVRICCVLLQMRKQDGTDYKPNSVVAMVTSALRAYNTAAADKALKSKQALPRKLVYKDCALLENNLTAVMTQLHQQGLKTEHQEELSPQEYQQVLQRLEDLPASSFKHTMRGVMILAGSWGGRVSEFHIIERK
jgi:hypothetical protein